MSGGHKRGLDDPTVSQALRMERNKRYYASRKAAMQLLDLAKNDTPPAGSSGIPPLASGRRRGPHDPTLSKALRKERNKRYYLKRKAIMQSRNLATNDQPPADPTANPTTTTTTPPLAGRRKRDLPYPTALRYHVSCKADKPQDVPMAKPTTTKPTDGTPAATLPLRPPKDVAPTNPMPRISHG